MKPLPTIVWFQNDFRLHDNAALYEASRSGKPIIPLYIHAPEEEGKWLTTGAAKAWLHFSLEKFADDIKNLGAPLLIRKASSSLEEIQKIIKETKADCIYWNKRHEPHFVERDRMIFKNLQSSGIDIRCFVAHSLFDPKSIKNQQGDPYRVYTPFSKYCFSELEAEPPKPKPKKIEKLKIKIPSLEPKNLKLLPQIRWDKKLWEHWDVGEEAAIKKIKAFKKRIQNYDKDRDFPSIDGVSKISPHLHFGEISSRRIWKELGFSPKTSPYLRQIIWRDFAIYSLLYSPDMPKKNINSKFDKFPWKKNKGAFEKWKKGQTGYPIVDAGMRELWQTGWMHNRVRMIAGSFLIKDLFIDWRKGQDWFWETLLDADLANNAFGWQWVAGSGLDAAPYFRIFNPITQGQKFDPNGQYIRRYIPELEKLPNKYLHAPWTAPPLLLQQLGIQLGKTYPRPMVDHKTAREEALEAFKGLK